MKSSYEYNSISKIYREINAHHIKRRKRSNISLVFRDCVMVNEQIARISMNNPTLLYVSLVVCFIVSLRHSWQYFSHITMRHFIADSYITTTRNWCIIFTDLPHKNIQLYVSIFFFWNDTFCIWPEQTLNAYVGEHNNTLSHLYIICVNFPSKVLPYSLIINILLISYFLRP